MKRKTLTLAVMVCSAAILAFVTSAVPHIGLLLLGLGFLGLSFTGVVTLIGILLAVGTLMKLFTMGTAGIADQLLQ